jgi:hypothetical protein
METTPRSPQVCIKEHNGKVSLCTEGCEFRFGESFNKNIEKIIGFTERFRFLNRTI